VRPIATMTAMTASTSGMSLWSAADLRRWPRPTGRVDQLRRHSDRHETTSRASAPRHRRKHAGQRDVSHRLPAACGRTPAGAPLELRDVRTPRAPNRDREYGAHQHDERDRLRREAEPQHRQRQPGRCSARLACPARGCPPSRPPSASSRRRCRRRGRRPNASAKPTTAGEARRRRIPEQAALGFDRSDNQTSCGEGKRYGFQISSCTELPDREQRA